MDFKILYDFISGNNVINNNKTIQNAKNFINNHMPGMDKASGDAFDNVLGSLTAGSNSIKFRSRASIAQYPVLVSDSLSFKTVQIVNGALEAQYASMLALILQNSANERNASSASDVLKQYHNNIAHNPKLDVNFKKESFNPYFLCGTDSINSLKEANKELLIPADKLLNENTLNSISYTRDFMTIIDESKNHSKGSRRAKNNAKNFSTKTRLVDSDVKKANDLAPTILTMDINFGSGKDAISKQVSIGVKCVSHMILSDDIEYYLTKTAFKNSPIVRLIQWTTGEISFFKDLLFTIDDIKRSAIKSNSNNGYWWRKLESISKVARSNKILGGPKQTGKAQPIPVTTMVISKEDVDNIKFRHGFNLLENPDMIQKIITNYYLLNFLIVDEGTDTYYMFNEDTKVLERYPKSAFQKMSSKDKFDVEELYKMLK